MTTRHETGRERNRPDLSGLPKLWPARVIARLDLPVTGVMNKGAVKWQIRVGGR